MTKKEYDASHYEHPSVTVDMVIFTIQDDELKVLLAKRKNWPYKDRWAIPGGFVRMKESLDDAAKRELYEETHVKDVYLEQLYAFGDPKRDPRTRVITIAYYALVKSEDLTILADTDVKDVKWHSTAKLPKLAFDHEKIVSFALRRLRSKILTSNISFQLLPEHFTLTELQKVYETVLGRPLDKRNFRRKVLSLGVIKETEEKKLEGRHRPAQLFTFNPEADLD
ncbi:MAG: NUDIX domain-containing protein [Candidatus Eremiobacteraeota bacterium]|nr:NUDIX domain-containing protein [Candidatus Eremiobacteraeota bacterium]